MDRAVDRSVDPSAPGSIFCLGTVIHGRHGLLPGPNVVAANVSAGQYAAMFDVMPSYEKSRPRTAFSYVLQRKA